MPELKCDFCGKLYPIMEKYVEYAKASVSFCGIECLYQFILNLPSLPYKKAKELFKSEIEEGYVKHEPEINSTCLEALFREQHEAYFAIYMKEIWKWAFMRCTDTVPEYYADNIENFYDPLSFICKNSKNYHLTDESTEKIESGYFYPPNLWYSSKSEGDLTENEIQFYYEPHKLNKESENLWYVPDFYIAPQCVWLELKGTWKKDGEDEAKFLKAQKRIGRDRVILIGPQYFEELRTITDKIPDSYIPTFEEDMNNLRTVLKRKSQKMNK